MEKSILIIIFLILAACEPEMKVQPVPELTKRQQKLFEVNCALCHANENSNAPQLGSDEWDIRFAKGFDVLMKSVIEGTEGMQPLGGCAACNYEDLEILVQFTAQRGKNK